MENFKADPKRRKKCRDVTSKNSMMLTLTDADGEKSRLD